MAEGNESLKTFTWLDRVIAWSFLGITPEHVEIKRAKATSQAARPTFAEPPPMPIFQYREIAGFNVRYAHAARSGAPVLILLSPLPQSILAFAPMWQRLSSRFELYAYDLPGFGRSEGNAACMTFTAQGRFLGEFIRSFDISKPHIVGSDIGMGAALAYVALQAGDVESLIIGDGPGIAPSANGSVIHKMATSGFWRTVIKLGGAGAFINVGNELGYLNYVPNTWEISDYLYSYAGRIGQVTEWFKNYPQSLASVDPHLDSINTPVLILWGDHDQFLLVDNAYRLSNRLPRNRLHVITQCGHFAYQDKHEEFATQIIDWVEGSYART